MDESTYKSYDKHLEPPKETCSNYDQGHYNHINDSGALAKNNHAFHEEANTLPRRIASNRKDDFLKDDNTLPRRNASQQNNDSYKGTNSLPRRNKSHHHHSDEMIDMSTMNHHDSYEGYHHQPRYHHGIISDHYGMQSQEWIVPRRIMCAFFWVGVMLLFTGIVLLVTSKHQDGAYTSWGAVMLGLGFCLLLICFLLCVRAYCVISDENESDYEEQPSMPAIHPPSPGLSTHRINNAPPSRPSNPCQNNTLSDVQRCYGSFNKAHEDSSLTDNEDSKSHDHHSSTRVYDDNDNKSHDHRSLTRVRFQKDDEHEGHVRFCLHNDTITDTNDKAVCQKPPTRIPIKYDEKHKSSDDKSDEFTSRAQEGKQVNMLGKLPSYTTACKMANPSNELSEKTQSPIPKGTSSTEDRFMANIDLTSRESADLKNLDNAQLQMRELASSLDVDRVVNSLSYIPKHSNESKDQNTTRCFSSYDNFDKPCVFTSSEPSRNVNYNSNISSHSQIDDAANNEHVGTHIHTMQRTQAIDNRTMIGTQTNIQEPGPSLLLPNTRTLHDNSLSSQTMTSTSSSLTESPPRVFNMATQIVQQDTSGSDSPALSMYDNINLTWRPKSGSELRHFHF